MKHTCSRASLLLIRYYLHYQHRPHLGDQFIRTSSNLGFS